jgi:hypothetical protein
VDPDVPVFDRGSTVRLPSPVFLASGRPPTLVLSGVRRATVASGRSTSWRSTVRRIGEALWGSENRETGGVYTVFTARPNVYRRSR